MLIKRFVESTGEPNGWSYYKKAIAENGGLGAREFEERLFNNENLTETFLSKNLRLPIPQEELKANEAISSGNHNEGY